MRSAIANLLCTLRRAAGEPVTVTRGALAVDLTAGVGSSTHDQIDQQGTLHRVTTRDYLIDALDYRLGGSQVEPAEGDTFTGIDAAGVTRVYTCMAIQGEQPWRYTDPLRVGLRIHTKLTSET